MRFALFTCRFHGARSRGMAWPSRGVAEKGSFSPVDPWSSPAITHAKR